MQKKKNNVNTSKKADVKRKNRFLIIFVSAFVSVVLILGITLGAIARAKDANSIASYGGTRMSREVAVYFASVFKSDYKASLSNKVSGVEDSPGFWNSISQTGEPYIDLLTAGAKENIRQIMVMNYLFDRYSSLSSEDKKIIDAAVLGTLKNHGGSIESFNAAAEKYGFDYDSYKEAVVMLYKAASLETLICGSGGVKLKASTDESVISARNEFLEEYSHVKLLYINTEYKFVLDDKGNRVTYDDGTYKTEELTAEEKAERMEVIETIRSAIAAIGTDGVQMGPDMFENYMQSEYYSGMLETRQHGYYFQKGTLATEAFDSQNIVDKAIGMKVGAFDEVALDSGVCFIYKLPTDSADLSVSALESFFVDFYERLSDRFIGEQVSHLTPDVKIKDEFNEIDLIVLPYNYEFQPSFVG